MIKGISLKTLLRSKTKSVLLIALVLLVCLFCVMGVSLYFNSNQLLQQADEQFSTMAVIEYTAGKYPDETNKSQDVLERLDQIDENTFTNQEQVKAVHVQENMMGYVEGAKLNLSFKAPFLNYAVVVFRVLYDTEDGGYRCSLAESIYGDQFSCGTTFGLSQGTLEELGERRLEVGHLYISAGDFRKEENQVVLSAMKENGMAKETNPSNEIEGYPFVDITEHDGSLQQYLQDDEAMREWNQIADFYRVQNGSFSTVAVDRLECQTDFFLGVADIDEGRAFTKEEAKEGKKVCVLHKSIAAVLAVNVGDTITIKSHYPKDQTRYYESYNPEEGFDNVGEYEVVGIYSLPQLTLNRHIYIPKNSVEHLPENQLHYAYANIEIENGSGYEYEKAVASQLENHVQMRIFDQGYTQTVAPIQAMKTNSTFIILLSMICATAILLLFATIHITKQREAVAIMTALGTGKKRIHAYLAISTAVLAGIGTVIGAGIGYIFSGRVSQWVYQYSVNQFSKDLRFSNLTMGIQKNFQGTITKSIWVLLIVGIGIYVSTFLISWFFSTKLIKESYCFGGNKPKKRKPKKEVVQKISSIRQFQYENREIVVTKESFKKKRRICFIFEHSRRSIRRNASVSMLMLLIPAVSAIFMMIFSHIIDNYYVTREEAYHTIPVNAYFVNATGNYLDQKNVSEDITQIMSENSHVKNVYRSGSVRYEYVGRIPAQLKGKEYRNKLHELVEKEAIQLEVPASSFAAETRTGELSNRDRVILTENIERSKEFFGTTPPKIEYVLGQEDIFYTEDKFALDNNGIKIFNVIADANFMKENGIQLGDTLIVGMVEIKTGKSMSGQLSESYIHEPAICKVVGSYYSTVQSENMYTSYVETQRWLDYCNYELGDVKDLNSLRDELEVVGVTPVGYLGERRVSFIIEDKALVQTVENIDNTIIFLRLLRYILFGLIVIIGFVSAYLSMRTRQKEVAMIRSMGTGKIRTFYMFFQEQFIVTLAGSIVGMVISMIVIGIPDLTKWMMVGILFLCYMLGNGICIMRMNRENILETLSVSE